MLRILVVVIALFVSLAAPASAAYKEVKYNNRTFQVGCEGIRCAIVVPIGTSVRSTIYAEAALDWFEGCYGSDALCDLVDIVVSVRLGIPPRVLAEMRQVYREAESKVLDDFRGHRADWHVTVGNPRGYTACEFRWTLKSARGNASVAFSPRDSAVQLAGQARAQGDKGSWVEGLLQVVFIKSGEFRAQVRAGNCGKHTTKFIKINSNNPHGSYP
jgi:hypothetical protein